MGIFRYWNFQILEFSKNGIFKGWESSEIGNLKEESSEVGDFKDVDLQRYEFSKVRILREWILQGLGF